MEHFLLLDLETTGLDPGRCRVIEVAARLLTPGREIARYHSLVNPGDAVWEPGARKMHEASGLGKLVRDCDVQISEVDLRMSHWLLEAHVEKGARPYLMGNSVHFDRSFMVSNLPLTLKRLHYRQLDVTSVRLWHILMSGEDPYIELPQTHRAEEDIENSLKQAMSMWQMGR